MALTPEALAKHLKETKTGNDTVIAVATAGTVEKAMDWLKKTGRVVTAAKARKFIDEQTEAEFRAKITNKSGK